MGGGGSGNRGRVRQEVAGGRVEGVEKILLSTCHRDPNQQIEGLQLGQVK